jgi:beta-galactosidase GanA
MSTTPRKLLLSLLVSLLPSAAPFALGQSTMPRIVQQEGRYALTVDGKPYLMLGAQINNSSAWPAELPKVWPVMEKLHVNTVEMPIYWEQWEPTEGHFDPSVLHTLIDQARTHKVHLVLLWFGTWKNGSGHYTPPFVKLDEANVPHVVGESGRKVDSLSPFSSRALQADRAAFVALMRELKTYDPQHTVLMVQVENETGTYGSVRDFSPEANTIFAGQVPASLVKALDKQPGTWTQVFGKDADEFFHAWAIAHFVDQVASAGKTVNPLPMYVNVALRDPFHSGKPGSYASGGPTDNVIGIWKAAAPSIDLIGPDLYNPGFAFYEKVLDLYHRPDNALFVPETGNEPVYAHYFFAALGHQAIGFSVFGMDETGASNYPLGAAKIDDAAVAPFALVYQIFSGIDREVAQLNFAGKLQAVAEDPDNHYQSMTFPGWTVDVSYGLPQFGGDYRHDAPGNKPVDGGAMVAQLSPSEFLVTGVHTRIDFKPTNSAKQRQFVRVEEGTYDASGTWHMARIWNGDQTDYGLNFTSLPQVLKVTLATY